MIYDRSSAKREVLVHLENPPRTVCSDPFELKKVLGSSLSCGDAAGFALEQLRERGVHSPLAVVY